ncbi:MAG: PAS domain S-box protein [Spirochaetia bacterium]
MHTYLAGHPRVLKRAIHSIKVVDVNDVTLQLYEAKDKKELLGPLDITLDTDSIPGIKELVTAIAEGREGLETESTALTRKGRKLDLLIKYHIPAESDEYPYALASIIDISERKRLEHALSEERAMLRAVIDAIPDIIFLKDRQSRFILANQATADVMGASSPAELIGKTDREFYPADMAEEFLSDERDVIENSRPLIDKGEPKRIAGSIRWIAQTKLPVRDAEGRITGLVGTGRDFTERRRSEEALRESEERYRTVFMDAPAGIFHSTLEGKILSVNPAFARMMGYDSPEQIVEAVNRKNVAEVLYEDPQGRPVIIDALVRDPGWHKVENRYRHKNGGVVVAQLMLRMYVPPGATDQELEGFVEDITERRLAEQALSRERTFLTALMDNIPDYIYFKDRESRFILNNRAHAQALGAGSPSEMLGKSDFDYFGPEHAQKAFDDEQRIIRTGQPLVGAMEEETRPNRPPSWVSSTKMPLRDEKGAIIGTFGVSRDMTEHRQMEQKNLRLATLVDSSDDAIVGTDLERRITVWNKGAERIYGYAAEEVLGATLSPLIPSEYEEETRIVRERVMRGEQVTNFETTRLRKDGSRITVSMTLSAIRDSEGKIVGMASTARDVTAQKAFEAQINRAQRLESLATLAGGVAHQFNNINAAISGCLQMLQSEKELSPEAASYVKAASAGVQKAVNITDRLLVLTEPGGASESLRLDVLARTVLSLHEKRIEEEKVRLVLDLAGCPLVVGSEKSLKFVLASLIGNALDSLLDRPERMLAVRTGSRENAAYCEVGDSGCGIPTEALPRIFSPFFSAKGEWAPTGSPQARLKGVGLSLAICSRFVSECGGRIDVESVPQQGSTFRVWFPAATSTPTETKEG